MFPLAVVISVASGLLGGCSRLGLPSLVHKIDVQQGNVIDQNMLAQLEPGMDKNKVLFVMGTPLIKDVFNQERWDYVYSEQQGGGKRVQRRVSLYFKDDLLARVDGNVQNASGVLVPQGNKTTSVNVPPKKGTGVLSRLKDGVGFGNDEPAKKVETRKKKGVFARFKDKLMGQGEDSNVPVYNDPTNPDQQEGF